MTAVKAKPADARELWHLLHGQGFKKARELDMPDRKIRAVCSEFPEHFISTQAGYKVAREATEGELENAISDLRSRAKETTRRATALEGVLHDRHQRALL